MIFEVYQSYYEERCPFLFEGPDMSRDEWKTVCDSLWNEAAQQALTLAGDGFVTAFNVVDAMLPLLEAKGFRRVEPAVKYGYFGAILRPDSEGFEELPFDEAIRDLIVKHNDVVWNT